MRILLSLLLVVAGVVHVVRPELFDPAIPFGPKLLINYLAGLIEIVLGVGLWPSRFKDHAARLTALWFLVLTPIHVYISINEIPIFGVSHPAILWGRTVLQAGLFFWALSLQEKGWIIAQRWSDVVFLHYAVDPKKLQAKVPFPLDLYEGKAIVSIVPFVMGRIRFPFIPPIPGLSSLLELNLRTYVVKDGRAAVYFFTLDSNHLPGVLIARWFFSLPYRWIKLRFSKAKYYEFSSPELKLRARIGDPKTASAFERWASERYALFTKRGETEFVGVVEHVPWTLQELEVVELVDEFSLMLGEELRMKEFIGCAYARELDVRFRPFRRL
ncbi:MAG: DUF2071 domain-containing protein [Bacteriovoracia bacterium]